MRWTWTSCALAALALVALVWGGEPSGHALIDAVQRVALVACLVLVAGTVLVRSIVHGQGWGPSLVGRALLALVLCAAAARTLGVWAVPVAAWIDADPGTAAALGLAAAIAAAAIAASGVNGPPAPRPTSHDTPPMAAAVIHPHYGQPLPPRERAQIAAHEAGHVLVCAALGGLPPNFSAVVHATRDTNGEGGHVTPIERTGMDGCGSHRWFMLLMAAGKQAELYLTGSHSAGSMLDHSQWLTEADRYLRNFDHGPYYCPPASEHEAAGNRAMAAALLAEQQATLAALFARNDAVLRELQAALIERGRLERAELVARLRQVVLPDGFPRPLGRFAAFSDEWHGGNGWH